MIGGTGMDTKISKDLDIAAIDLQDLPTPCYILDEAAFERNLKILDQVQERTGCKILLALKGFAAFSIFPQIRQHLSGVAASSLTRPASASRSSAARFTSALQPIETMSSTSSSATSTTSSSTPSPRWTGSGRRLKRPGRAA